MMRMTNAASAIAKKYARRLCCAFWLDSHVRRTVLNAWPMPRLRRLSEEIRERDKPLLARTGRRAEKHQINPVAPETEYATVACAQDQGETPIPESQRSGLAALVPCAQIANELIELGT